MKKLNKKNNPIKIILLRADCPALEGAVNLELQRTPNFFENYGDTGNPLNDPIHIYKDWHGLSFIAVKDSCEVNNLKPEDILIYLSASIKRPHSTIVNQISLFSFCDDLNIVLQSVSEIAKRLNEVYGINNIGFTAVEGETTHRLFNLVIKDQKLSDKYFKGWIGRHVGYKTNHSFSQKGQLKNLHIFEILKND